MNVFAKIYPVLANFEREIFLKNKESEIICFFFFSCHAKCRRKISIYLKDIYKIFNLPRRTMNRDNRLNLIIVLTIFRRNCIFYFLFLPSLRLQKNLSDLLVSLSTRKNLCKSM